MASMTIGHIGDRVLLQRMVAVKLYVGETMVSYGYTPSGKPTYVEILAVHGCFIIDPDHNLWKLLPEHDDDYYAVVAPTGAGQEFVTIPKHRYEHLQSESRFLAALCAAGVDNWEGFSLAHRKMHCDDDTPDQDHDDDDEDV